MTFFFNTSQIVLQRLFSWGIFHRLLCLPQPPLSHIKCAEGTPELCHQDDTLTQHLQPQHHHLVGCKSITTQQPESSNLPHPQTPRPHGFVGNKADPFCTTTLWFPFLLLRGPRSVVTTSRHQNSLNGVFSHTNPSYCSSFSPRHSSLCLHKVQVLILLLNTQVFWGLYVHITSPFFFFNIPVT